MDVVHDVVNALKDLGLYALLVAAFVKIATSLVVALLAKEFNFSEFGEMFRKDFLRLLVVTGLIIIYPNDAANTAIVTGYMVYLGARITANVGAIFPEFGDMLPAAFQGKQPADSPPLTPEPGVDG